MLYAIRATGGESVGLFYDAEGTQQAHKSDYDWKDLFLKGLIRVCTIRPNNLCNPYQLFLSDKEPPMLLFNIYPEGSVAANFFPDEENGSAPGGGLLPIPGDTVPDDGK